MGSKQATMPYGSNDGEIDPETGRFRPKYADSDFLAAIEELPGEPTTTEISEAVGAPYQSTYSRLKDLDESGDVASRKRGSVKVWRVAESGDVDPGRVRRAIQRTAPDSETEEIAHTLDVNRQVALSALRDMEDAGDVEYRQIGETGVWRLAKDSENSEGER